MKKAASLLHDHCVELTEVDETLIAKSRAGFLPEDERLSCYIDCLFRTSGLITEEGKIRFNEISHLFPTEIKEVIDKITAQCNTIRK